MADKVHLTKKGIQAFKYDGEAGQYVEQNFGSALEVLRCACHIDADVTLGDIFNAVAQDPQLAGFLERWSGCEVEAFHTEALKRASEQSDLTCIQIVKYFEWDEWEAQEIIDVSGIGEADEHGNTHYGIDFTPVNELVHLPVQLEPQMKIYKEHKELAQAPCTFTLLDVLGEIYWEISFHGSPENRDERGAELRERVREVKEGRAGRP